MKKYYRVVLINKETVERSMMVDRFTSRKRAIETVTKFCLVIGNKADFEVKML